jgi:Flagellar hook-length control protein
MTTTHVTKGVNPLMGFASPKQAGGLQDELTGSFTDAFSKATGQQNMSLSKDAGVKQNAQVKAGGTEQKVQDETKAIKIKDSSQSQNSVKAKDTQTVTRVQDEAEKAGQELVGEVAEALGVTEEEVLNAMELLGLTFADLLNADNMTQLVLTVKDADMLSLMTDGGLYDSLQSLLGAAEQKLTLIGEETGLTPEELAAIMEQLNRQTEAQPKAETNARPDVNDGTDTALPDGQEDYTVTVERNGEVMKVSVEVDGNAKTETSEVTNMRVEAPKEESAEPVKKDGGAKQESSSQNSSTQSNLFLDNLLNRENTVAQPDAAFETAMADRTVDTQEIMNQIMNYMRIQVKADMTQMQLQLHPASLGTVNINIASKEGVITAQFMTQNEAVKSVLESQIVQLKTNFEEQGIKVEAVEVTVESHAFERNLNGEGESRQTAQEGKKRGVRKLNLNEMDAEEAAESEEDQLAVEMMRAGGNTVDFTA